MKGWWRVRVDGVLWIAGGSGLNREICGETVEVG